MTAPLPVLSYIPFWAILQCEGHGVVDYYERPQSGLLYALLIYILYAKCHLRFE